jgi:glycosyltransferase involved in cell wall biosynthesis
MPGYFFIVPVYNEEENILEFYGRMASVMDKLDAPSELMFVNDGSKDGSINHLRMLQQTDSRVTYVSLARNFGQQIAITAGLNYVKERAVIILDADLQDPPELIPAMIQKWKLGYDVIYAKRTGRRNEPALKCFTAFMFYRILNRVSKVDMPTDAGDFCLLDRKVADVLNSMPENNRYIRGLRVWAGFNQTCIEYEREARHAGVVKYTFKQSLRLALNAVFSFSKLPLRLSTYLGIATATGAVIMAFVILYWRIFQPNSPVAGHTIIMMAVFFIGAIQLISVGILGEYIGRIYEEVKRRPLYTVNEVGGLIEKKQVQGATAVL